jgi:hypothetical protein
MLAITVICMLQMRSLRRYCSITQHEAPLQHSMRFDALNMGGGGAHETFAEGWKKGYDISFGD